MPFEWDRQMLESLEGFGIRPTAATPPALVKDYVGALYRYELRLLRDRLMRGEIRKPAYAGLVAALRPRYWMLSMPAANWARPLR
jgi:hypothetical protein